VRTTTAKSIFDGVANIYGKTDLSADDLIFVAESLDSEHLTEAWSFANWKELDVIEQRFYAQNYASINIYAAGDFVYYPATDKYYTALEAPAPKPTPAMSASSAAKMPSRSSTRSRATFTCALPAASPASPAPLTMPPPLTPQAM